MLEIICYYPIIILHVVNTYKYTMFSYILYFFSSHVSVLGFEAASSDQHTSSPLLYLAFVYGQLFTVTRSHLDKSSVC